MDKSGPPLYDGVNRIDLVEECISSSLGNVLFYDVEGEDDHLSKQSTIIEAIYFMDKITIKGLHRLHITGMIWYH
jgi:hypothetical protein